MYVIAPISSSRLTSSVIRLSWPIASTRAIQSRRSLGPKPWGLAPRWAAAGVPGETLISSMGSASAESIRCGERERKPPPRLLLERILDRTPAASRQASPRHVEIDRVLLLALVPTGELGRFQRGEGLPGGTLKSTEFSCWHSYQSWSNSVCPYSGWSELR